jgi:hypothetical protein
MTNEEILFQYVPGEDLYSQIELMLDAARKDEVMAWEEWKRVHYIYSVIRHDMTVGLFYNKVRYSFDELYTIFKQQNS